MNKQIRTFVGTAVAALLLSSTATMTLAQDASASMDIRSSMRDGGSNRSEHRGRAHQRSVFSQRMLQKLDWELELSTEQRDKIRSLIKVRQDRQQGAQSTMRQLRQAMQKLQPGSADYRQQVAELAQKQADAMRQQIIDRAEGYADVYEVLTPVQQQKFSQLKQQWQEKRSGKKSRREQS